TPAGPMVPTGPAPQEALPPPASSAPAPDEGALPGSDDESSAPPRGQGFRPPPPRRTMYTAAVIQVLDKVTAESLRFEAPLHKFIRYKGLIFLVNTCQSGQPDQPPYAAHLEVDSQPPALPGRPPNAVKLVFRGWMFTDTPGVHPFEHPVYDTWLIACKTVSVGE
ncbi:MAG TPA: DUF2155 domain-containing protein, partial [Caulobacteraceae bacterium]